MVPPTQTNSINTDECSRGSIPVYSTPSSSLKRVRFHILPDLVIFPTDFYDVPIQPTSVLNDNSLALYVGKYFLDPHTDLPCIVHKYSGQIKKYFEHIMLTNTANRHQYPNHL